MSVEVCCHREIPPLELPLVALIKTHPLTNRIRSFVALLDDSNANLLVVSCTNEASGDFHQEKRNGNPAIKMCEVSVRKYDRVHLTSYQFDDVSDKIHEIKFTVTVFTDLDLLLKDYGSHPVVQHAMTSPNVVAFCVNLSDELITAFTSGVGRKIRVINNMWIPPLPPVPTQFTKTSELFHRLQVELSSGSRCAFFCVLPVIHYEARRISNLYGKYEHQLSLFKDPYLVHRLCGFKCLFASAHHEVDASQLKSMLKQATVVPEIYYTIEIIPPHAYLQGYRSPQE